MEEHYNILKELVKRKSFDVKLIYNTNFSKMIYKGQNVLKWGNYLIVLVLVQV